MPTGLSLSAATARPRVLLRSLLDPELRRRVVVQALVRSAERRADMTYLALDYPPSSADQPRFGWGKPPHREIGEILDRRRDVYASHLRELAAFEADLCRIGATPSGVEPGWIQRPPWMLGLDGVSLYGFVRLRTPARYIEVGSGNSTKFAARARRDGHLRTHMTSIDPHPRAEIDALCDEVVRAPLESSDLSAFGSLDSGDMIFFDGSHRSFMNSDATVFFLEILPSLAPGVLVGVHDIFLPHDYPPQWGPRYYSEQYLLACYLLAQAPLITPILPCYHVGFDPELNGILDPLWSQESMRGVDTRGFTFWFTVGGYGVDAGGNRA